MLMPSDRVVLARASSTWARFRVHGLLRDPVLAARLRAHARAQGLPALDPDPATGSVRVALATDRDPGFWQTWLADRLGDAASATARRRRPRAAAAAASTAAPTDAPSAAGPPRPAQPRAGPPMPAPPTAAPPSADDETPHAEPLAALLARLGVRAARSARSAGLAAGEAEARLRRDGPNELHDVTGRTAAQILLDQFTSVPVGLLGASAAMALATRAFADAGAIGAVLAANSTLGFVTEQRAEQTVASLRKLAPREATVIRDGERRTIDAREVVAGDLLVLEPGRPVAADARVVDAHRLATNEAALTGESLPVRKEPVDAMPADTPLGERRNMVFLGTVVSGGMGLAVVVATGERAALGRIRRLAQQAEAPRTQLQTQLDVLGRRLAVGAVGLCAGVFVLGLLRGRAAMPLLRTAVSLGVAAIPEGLPTVATSLLASGIRSLQRRQVYARSLDAVENLGAIDTVCFDKTGTLTQNRMSVTSMTVGARVVRVDAATAADALRVPPAWLRVAALNNTLVHDDGPAEGTAGPSWTGSSTELALLELGVRLGADRDALGLALPTVGVRHRSEHHPYMVTLHAEGSGLFVAVKGRPDQVLARCERWWDGDAERPLRAADRRALLGLNDVLAGRGERVLALAGRHHPDRAFGETAGLTWLGLVGLADPLRDGLPEMIGRFRRAGIRPLMITGDQLGTARTVGEAIGLSDEAPIDDAASHDETPETMGAVAERASGFARTTPAMKLAIVRGLQQRGHVVAMTGDGINDGPALKTADVGVAMGVTGTDFAHAMSDLVLRDDHPAAMLAAIEEGRTAFLNIRKSVRYLVATNLSELAATAIAVGAGLPEPLEPLALLWTNLVTDVWPAIALGLEPAEPGVLERPPVSLKAGLLERSDWRALAVDAGTMTTATLASFGYGLTRYGAGPQARTLAFCTLTASQLLYAFTMRSSRPLLAGGLAPNPMLTRAVAWSLAAQAGTILLPPARRLLRTAPVGPTDLLVIAVTAAAPLLVRESLKHASR